MIIVIKINLAFLHMLCNSAKGRVDFEDGWLIKSCFINKGEIKLDPGSKANKKIKIKHIPNCFNLTSPHLTSPHLTSPNLT
jgi:hypothetical protein